MTPLVTKLLICSLLQTLTAHTKIHKFCARHTKNQTKDVAIYDMFNR